MEESFGEILSRYRKKIEGLTQEKIASSDLKLSGSNIALLESQSGQDRKTPLTEDQVWYLAEKVKIFPPDLDDFLEKAQQTRLRSEKRELYIQENYPNLKELWIFAKVIRDVDENWYKVVKQNIVEREVKYCYFTTTQTKCRKLFNKLNREGIPKSVLNERLECYIFPEKLFMANFAIYNPAEKNRYCCGTVFENGKATSFYTYEKGEAETLYVTLDEWRTNILENDYIRLGDAYKVPLEDSAEKPIIKYNSSFTQELGK